MVNFNERLQDRIKSYEKEPLDVYTDLAQRLQIRLTDNPPDEVQLKKSIALEFQQHLTLSDSRKYIQKLLYPQIRLFNFSLTTRLAFYLLHFAPKYQRSFLRFVLMKKELIPCKNKFESELTKLLEPEIIEEYQEYILEEKDAEYKSELKNIWDRLLTKKNTGELNIEDLNHTKKVAQIINSKIADHHKENYDKIRSTLHDFIYKPYKMILFNWLGKIGYKKDMHDDRTFQLVKLLCYISNQKHLTTLLNRYFNDKDPLAPYENIEAFSEEILQSLIFIQDQPSSELGISKAKKNAVIKYLKAELNEWNRSKHCKKQLTRSENQQYKIIRRKNDYIAREIRRKKKELIRIFNFLFTLLTALSLAIIAMFELFIFGTNPLLIPLLGMAMFYTSVYMFGPVIKDIFQRMLVKGGITYGFNSKLGKLFCSALGIVALLTGIIVSAIGAGFLFSIPLFSTPLTILFVSAVTTTSIISYTALTYRAMAKVFSRICNKAMRVKDFILKNKLSFIFPTIKNKIKNMWTPRRIACPAHFVTEEKIRSDLFHHRCKMICSTIIYTVVFPALTSMFIFSMIATLGTYQMELAALMRTFLGLTLTASEITSKVLIYTTPVMSLGIFNYDSFVSFAKNISTGIGSYILAPIFANSIEFIFHPLTKSKQICLKGIYLGEKILPFIKEIKTNPNKTLIPVLRIVKHITIDMPIIKLAAMCQAILAIGGGISIAKTLKIPLNMSKSLSLISESFSSVSCNSGYALHRFRHREPLVNINLSNKKQALEDDPIKKRKNIKAKTYTPHARQNFFRSRHNQNQYFRPSKYSVSFINNTEPCQTDIENLHRMLY